MHKQEQPTSQLSDQAYSINISGIGSFSSDNEQPDKNEKSLFMIYKKSMAYQAHDAPAKNVFQNRATTEKKHPNFPQDVIIEDDSIKHPTTGYQNTLMKETSKLQPTNTKNTKPTSPGIYHSKLELENNYNYYSKSNFFSTNLQNLLLDGEQKKMSRKSAFSIFSIIKKFAYSLLRSSDQFKYRKLNSFQKYILNDEFYYPQFTNTENNFEIYGNNQVKNHFLSVLMPQYKEMKQYYEGQKSTNSITKWITEKFLIIQHSLILNYLISKLQIAEALLELFLIIYVPIFISFTSLSSNKIQFILIFILLIITLIAKCFKK